MSNRPRSTVVVLIALILAISGSILTAFTLGAQQAGASGRFAFIESVGEWIGFSNIEQIEPVPAQTPELLAPQALILWSSTGGSAWLTAGNWTGSVVPGAGDTGQFGVNPSSSTSVGINMNGATNNGSNNQIVGAIEVTSARSTPLTIGNSSTVANGTLTVAGINVNGIDNTIVRNNGSSDLTIQNTQGSGNRLMGIALGNPTENVVSVDGGGLINILSVITGSSRNLTVRGSGSGLAILYASNTYSGFTKISSSRLALQTMGTIASSSAIEIGGGTFDVSATNLAAPIILSSGQILRATGTTTTGNIQVGPTRPLTTASNSPIEFTAFNGSTPPFTLVGAGTLALQSGNPVTVNTTTQLGVGSHKLIAKGTGNVTGTPTSLTIGGSGICAGCTGSLTLTSGELFLTVTPPPPDLTISKTTSSTFVQGGTATYSLIVNNIGAGASSGPYTISDTMPTGLTIALPVTGSTWDCSASTTTFVNCVRSTAIPANIGSAPSVTVPVNIATNAPASITNTANVAGGGELNTSNNAGSVTSNVTPLSPELTITKVAQGSGFQQGGTVTYDITVTNNGNGPSTGTVAVTDIIPTGLTVTNAAGTNWTCSGTSTVSCTNTIAIPASGTSTLSIVANISASAPSSITNTVNVSGGGDSNTGNNAGTSVISVTQIAPELTITKVAQGSGFQQGGTVTYDITVTNNGNGPSTGTVTVTDIIPTGLTVTNAAGTNWTCSGTSTVSCTNTIAIPASGTSTLSIVANISASAPFSITNTVNVSGGGDSNTGNNAGTSVISVTASADLSITKTDGVATYNPGGSVTYTIVASNAGPSTATGVAVADTFAAVLTCSTTSVAAGGATGNTAGPFAGNINNTAMSFPPGGSVTYTSACSISGAATGNLVNTATVSSATADPNGGDNSATDTDTQAPPVTGVTALGAPAQNTGSATLAFTVPAGVKRLLVVTASDAADLDVASVTFGASPMTQTVERNDTVAVDSMWHLALGDSGVPTVGTITVTGFSTTQTVITAQAFQNVDQTTPIDGTGANNATGTNVGSSLTINTTTTGDLVFDLFDTFRNSGAITTTPGLGQTGIHDATLTLTTPTPGLGRWQTSTKPATPPSTTVSWTSNAAAIIQLAANINFAPTVATVTLVVDRTDDNRSASACTAAANDCSLGGAIVNANGTTANEIITFDATVFAAPQTISTGTNGVITIANNGSLTIDGTGVGQVSVNAGGLSRIFFVNGSASVTINALRLTGGSHTGGGGAIYVLTSGTLTLNNSILTANTGSSLGGAIRNEGPSTVNINSSTVSANTASGGGALFIDGTLNVTNSTISGNMSTGSLGAGLWQNSGTATITNSTISGNMSASHAGGIYNTGGSTINLRNSTITLNSAAATFLGGGVFNSATFNSISSIIAGNTASGGGPDFQNAVVSGGYNLVGMTDGSSGFTGTGDLTGTIAVPINPMLAALGPNGGPTQTHALNTGSPAIDQGNNPLALATDQRGMGFVRVFDSAPANIADGTDIGAFEASTTPNVVINGTNGDDVLVVTATGPDAGSYVLNGGPPVNITGVVTFVFNGTIGNDTFTINNPAGGLFAPSGGIDFNGGGQAGDNMNLLGGSASTETYFVGTTTPPIGGGAGNNGDGLIRYTGPALDIRFTGLAPIVDTVVVASLTVNSTDVANTIAVTNGGVAPRLRVAVDAFEPIDFDNKAAVVVNGGDGIAGGDVGDTMGVNFTNAPAGLTGLTINGDEGNDQIFFNAKNATVPLTLNGGANEAAPTVPFTCSITNTLPAGDRLVYSDSASLSDNTYNLSVNDLIRNAQTAFSFNTMETVDFLAGGGNDTISVDARTGVRTTARGNSGNDTMSLNVGSGAVGEIDGGGGQDTVTTTGTGAGSVTLLNGSGNNDTFTLVQAGGSMDNLSGNVCVDGGANDAAPGDIVNLNDAGDASNNTYTLTSTGLVRTGSANVGFGTFETLNLNAGTGGDTINVNSTLGLTNLNGGAGIDAVNFADAVSLNGGTIDGGADTDALFYNAYTTAVSVNLGLSTTTIGGTLLGNQEVPQQFTTAEGTVNITNYNAVARTFDIAVSVINLPPADVIGFHIHRAPTGVNGPIIVNLQPLAPLVPAGSGFTFTATGVVMPAIHEAAFLGGVTYVNIHTAAAPGGLIRAQVFSNGNVNLASGTATGTAGISNIESAFGGTGNDSMVGSFLTNSINGQGGNDTVLGGPGPDTMLGGNNNDTMIWSNGDGSDIIDGNADIDVVQINGNVANADVFTIGANATRVAFARTSAGPFTLDIGTSESLVVNGIGGDDTMSLNSLVGVADVSSVGLFGFDGNDIFNVVPAPNGGTRTYTVAGGRPTAYGDVLNIDQTGVTGGVLALDAQGNGDFTSTSHQPIAINGIEPQPTTTTVTSSVNPSVFGQNVTFTATVAAVPPGNIPVGTVQFVIDGSNFGAPVTLNGSGVAQVSTAALSVGPHLVVANYSGNSSFSPSSGNLTQTVNKADTTTGLASSANSSVFGQTVTFTATVGVVMPGAGMPTGIVMFRDGAVVIGTVALNGAGVATFATNSLSVATHPITAVYGGDGNFNGSMSSILNQVVNRADTLTTVQTAVNPPVYGQTMVITATVTAVLPGAGVPQGLVNFTDGGIGIPTCQGVMLSAFGAASCTVNNLGAGVNKVIGASYSGNTNYNPSMGTTLQTINPAPLVVTASSHTVTYGDAAPAITRTITGFVLMETEAVLTAQPTCSTTYTAGSNVSGSPYPTTCTGGAAANYSFTYVGGTVLVNKKALTVTADDKTRAYGAANPTLTAMFAGFVLGQNFATSGITGSAGLSTTATATSPVGTYPITVTLGTLASGNYSFASFTNGTLTVTAVQLTVTAENKTRVFGAPNPALTFTITGFVNGEGLGVLTGSPTLSTTAIATSSPGTYPITITQGTLANPNYTFTFTPGTLTVTQAATTTTITNAAALGTPTQIGQAYAVNWTTSPVAPGAGTLTGNVTVMDGTGAQCSAAVAVGTCMLTSTTVGIKTITANYPGDTNFTGSASQTVNHTVVIGVTGNVKQFVPFGVNTNLAGVTITLTGSATGEVTTDANGNYSFGLMTSGGSYVITPTGLGKTYEPITRTYTNVTTNITGADFVAYNAPGPGGNPREVKVINAVTTPGQPVTVPVEITSQGNETRLAFSLNYDVALLGVPTAVCGTGAAGCTITVNNSLAGRVGITIVPAGAAALTAGTRQIARVTFPTFPTGALSTPVSFGDNPTLRDVRRADNNPLPALYTGGFVAFNQTMLGFEGDVADAAGTNAGGDGVLANDVTIERLLVLGLMTAVTTPNQYQRADAAPRTTLGDGCPINAGDVTQVARYNLGLDPPTTTGGPTSPIPGGCAPPTRGEAPDEATRIIRALNTQAAAGQTVVVPIQLDAQGDETSASYTVNFNPNVLTFVRAEIGTGVPTGADIGTNTTQTAEGKVGILVSTANTYAKGKRNVLNLTFKVAAGAETGAYPLTFNDTPTPNGVANEHGEMLTTRFETGSVIIAPTAAGVTISGRVTTTTGQGLRNATVTITDANGNRRTTTTGSFGIYTFTNVEPGETYVIAIQARRYRFASRVINVTDSLTDVNFVGLE